MNIKRLREAMAKGPCPTHKDECPVPPKAGKKKRGCNWGHTAVEFADVCDFCANVVLAGLENERGIGQRMHHHDGRD